MTNDTATIATVKVSGRHGERGELYLEDGAVLSLAYPDGRIRHLRACADLADAVRFIRRTFGGSTMRALRWAR